MALAPRTVQNMPERLRREPNGPLDLLLLSRGDILSHGLRRSLHGFRGHIQIGQQFHLPAAMIEGGLLT
jgi:hypothetical protein